jgi:type I restriction enzyme M protein
MNADEFRDYILGFIFYKYLSERMNLYANEILKEDGILYQSIKEDTKQGKAILEAIREQALIKLGYFLKPSELFSEIAKRGNAEAEDENAAVKSNFILKTSSSNSNQKSSSAASLMTCLNAVWRRCSRPNSMNTLATRSMQKKATTVATPATVLTPKK